MIMKQSELKKIVKKDNDTFADGIEVWDKIEQAVLADNAAVEHLTPKKRIPLRVKMVAVFGSIGGSAVIAGIILLAVFLSGLLVLPPPIVKNDISAAYTAMIEAENLQFKTQIEMQYGSSTAIKTVNGNIENRKAQYEVQETYADSAASASLYTDGHKVYENNRLLDLKFIANMDAEQLYAYAYILSEFSENDFPNVQTVIVDGNTATTFKIITQAEFGRILEIINAIPEIESLLSTGIIKEVMLTFVLNEDKVLLSLELQTKITVGGAVATVTVTIEFSDVYETPIIEEPDDLDGYVQPSYEVSDALSAYNAAYNALFERVNYTFNASYTWYGGLFENATEYTVQSSGTGTSKVTYLKRNYTNLPVTDPNNVELWIHGGFEYKKTGDLKIKSALSYNESYQLKAYMHLVPSQTFTSGEVSVYNGKTYINLNASGSGMVMQNVGYSMMGFDNTLLMVLDENEQILSLIYKAIDTVGNEKYDTVLQYSFAEHSATVTLPDDIGDYVEKFETAFRTYHETLSAFREKSLLAFTSTFRVGSDVNSIDYHVIVEIDKEQKIGSLIYDYTGNGWYYEYKTYGYVYNQWYDGTYLYSVVEKSPYTVKELCTFEAFLDIVSERTSARGLDAFGEYSASHFSSVHIDDMDGFANGILFADLNHSKFAGLTECGLSYNVENGELAFLSIMAAQGNSPHYITIMDFREISYVHIPDDFSGYITI
jgi:hypothetical protein